MGKSYMAVHVYMHNLAKPNTKPITKQSQRKKRGGASHATEDHSAHARGRPLPPRKRTPI